MPHPNKSILEDSSEKYKATQREILESLKLLNIKFDTLNTSVAKCDETCEEIKRSVEDCIQTCKGSLEVSN